jgi:hypothetical protein
VACKLIAHPKILLQFSVYFYWNISRGFIEERRGEPKKKMVIEKN